MLTDRQTQTATTDNNSTLGAQCVWVVKTQNSTLAWQSLLRYKRRVDVAVGPDVCALLTSRYMQSESKNPPEVPGIFSQTSLTLGIFSPSFTDILSVLIYARLPIIIQLSPTNYDEVMPY